MAPGIGGIDQDEIEIAREPAMLEAVVEDQDFGLMFGDGDSRQVGAVGALQVHDVRQV